MNTADKAVSSSLQRYLLKQKILWFKIILDNFCYHALYLSYITFFTNLNKMDKIIKFQVFTHTCYMKY